MKPSNLTLSWPAGHICPTYKESFQVRWHKSIPIFLHAAIYLEVSLFRWTSQNAFSRDTAVCKWYCVHSIICIRLFCGKMHSVWFNGIEILQGRWQHREKVRYCYQSGLEKTICKRDIYVPLVTKELKLYKGKKCCLFWVTNKRHKCNLRTESRTVECSTWWVV